MRTIALVEDNPDNRLLVGAILGDLYNVVEFENGSEAVEGINGDTAELILLDISLPGMDGTEVLRHLRSNPATAELPVIALTAHAMAGDREKYLSLGFDDYVTKPIVDEQFLLDSIQRLLSRE